MNYFANYIVSFQHRMDDTICGLKTFKTLKEAKDYCLENFNNNNEYIYYAYIGFKKIYEDFTEESEHFGTYYPTKYMIRKLNRMKGIIRDAKKEIEIDKTKTTKAAAKRIKENEGVIRFWEENLEWEKEQYFKRSANAYFKKNKM